MRSVLAPLWGFGLLLAIGTSVSAQEWYEHYLTARERQVPQGRCQEAIRSLKQAVALKRSSALNEQTYGLQFVDYLPYYYLGLCYLRSGEPDLAEQAFDTEERHGAIRQRPRLYRDLAAKREEARAEIVRGEQRRLARQAEAKVGTLLARAAALERARQYDAALEQLNQAAQLALETDTKTQARVQDRISQVRAKKLDLAQRQALSKRIEEALADAERHLREGHDREAGVAFDEVLGLDPDNSRAQAGRHEVSQRMLAATTRKERLAALEKGEALVAVGRYEEALNYLRQAAADPNDERARRAMQHALRVMDGLKHEREKRERIEGLMAQGEELLSKERFSAAQVKFDEVAALDPTDVRAKERSAFAQQKAEERILEKRRPNRPPVLRLYEPSSTDLEVTSQTVRLEGFATDDRGLARLEFFLNGKLQAEQVEPAGQALGDVRREVEFKREFPLAAGPNKVQVRVTDTNGLVDETTLRVARGLRFYERPTFMPSAAASALALVLAGLVSQRLRRRRALKRRFNPYVAGAPVVEEGMFFGRQRVLSRVLNLLHHNSFMITGERRIGKTSFLLRLKRALEEEQHEGLRYFPVQIDLSGVPEESFFRSVIGDVVEVLDPSPETLAALRFSPERTRYDGRDLSHDLQEILGELGRRTDGHVKLALLMDEADVLNEYSERTNQLLRATFMKTFSEHLVAVLCGVGVKRTWNSDGSPWYNFFEQIRLEPFARKDAEALIRAPVSGIFRYEQQAVESILEHSGMKPYLIQKFCIQVVNRLLDEGRTTATALDVEAVRESVLADADPPHVPRSEEPGARDGGTVAD